MHLTATPRGPCRVQAPAQQTQAGPNGRSAPPPEMRPEKIVSIMDIMQPLANLDDYAITRDRLTGDWTVRHITELPAGSRLYHLDDGRIIVTHTDQPAEVIRCMSEAESELRCNTHSCAAPVSKPPSGAR